MKILLLGATGRTGSILLKLALEKGHSVHAIVRKPEKVKLQNKGLQLFQGKPNDPKVICQAMKGCEAVVSVLAISRTSDDVNAPLASPEDLLSSSISVTLTAMEEKGLSRIVVMTGNGAGASFHYLPVDVQDLLRNTNLGKAYLDHDRQEALLEKSNMDWTILRPVMLDDKTPTGDTFISLQNEPSPGERISREKVAVFILDCLENGLFVQQAPTISTEAQV